jgi:hypothetical protein
MANPDHLAIIEQGVEVWNVWRYQHPDIRPDLAGADLRKANLEVAVYRHPSNPEPDADPYGIDFTRAILKEADLSHAELWLPELRGCLETT